MNAAIAGAAFPKRRDLLRTAWLERRVSLACASGEDPVRHMEEFDIPGWFPAVELGLAPDAGPSIYWTAEHLDKLNRANRQAFEKAEREDDEKLAAKDPVLSRLKLENVSRKKLRRLLARKGILIRAGRYVDAHTGNPISN